MAWDVVLASARDLRMMMSSEDDVSQTTMSIHIMTVTVIMIIMMMMMTYNEVNMFVVAGENTQ